MTVPGDDARVLRRLSTASAALLAGLALAAGAGAATPLPRGWWHVEVNVMVKRVPHTLIYDQGRVVATGPSSLTLRERDGSTVVVAVDPAAKVWVSGVPGTLAEIQRRWWAMTVRIDGDPAIRVRARPPAVGAGAPSRTSGG